jgi:hypothetical protein
MPPSNEQAGANPDLHDSQPEAFLSRLNTRSRSKQRKNRPKTMKRLLLLSVIVLIWLAPGRGIVLQNATWVCIVASYLPIAQGDILRRFEAGPVENSLPSRTIISSLLQVCSHIYQGHLILSWR